MQDAPTSQLDLDGDIWRFALRLYGAPGCSDACLRLQDEAGIDVVNMIIVLYADAKLNRRLSGDQVNLLKAEMKRWRDETVLPLRRLRRRLKAPPAAFPAEETEALRNLIKKAELRSEQIQLAMGERWLSRTMPADGLTVETALLMLCEEMPDVPPANIRVLIEELATAARRGPPL